MNIVIYNGSTLKGNMFKIQQVLVGCLESQHNVEIIDSFVSPCKNCGYCGKYGRCCLKDLPIEKLEKADAIILLSPIFFFGFSAKTKAFLDRLYAYRLSGKILTGIITSGSSAQSPYCGIDLIYEVFIRISEYCGCSYSDLLHFVTEDSLINIDSDKVKEFVKVLEGTYDKVKKSVKGC